MNLDATFAQLAEEFQNTPIADTTLPVEVRDRSEFEGSTDVRKAVLESRRVCFKNFSTEEEAVKSAKEALALLAGGIQHAWSQAMDLESERGAVKLLVLGPRFAQMQWVNKYDLERNPDEDTGWFRADLTYVPVDVPRETP